MVIHAAWYGLETIDPSAEVSSFSNLYTNLLHILYKTFAILKTPTSITVSAL